MKIIQAINKCIIILSQLPLGVGDNLQWNICAFCVWTLEDGAAPDQNVGVDQWNVCQGSRGPMKINFE